jgi:hypothetical protein
MATKKIDFDGYSCEIDLDVFDDVRFFEMIDKLEENPSLNIEVAKMGLGEENYKKISEFFTKRDGKLKMSVVMGIVAQIFAEADPKDSASGSSEKNTQTN